MLSFLLLGQQILGVNGDGAIGLNVVHMRVHRQCLDGSVRHLGRESKQSRIVPVSDLASLGLTVFDCSLNLFSGGFGLEHDNDLIAGSART